MLYEMSENGENCQSQDAQGDISRYLLLSDEQPKSQTYSILYQMILDFFLKK